MQTDAAKKTLSRDLLIYPLAVLIGICSGLGAVAFRGLIAFFHNLLFLHTLSLSYDATIHTPASPWGPLVILVPVIGAVGVSFLVKNFAPEAKGSGVPEVIDAIYYHKATIRPVVVLVKSVAAALSIGSGASVGREGPIAQIGSAVGSTAGQLFGLPLWQRVTLIAAGTGGGIAATFNTPVGGIFFAAELLLHEFSVRTLVPLAISTATATYVGRLFFGHGPSFVIPGGHGLASAGALELLHYAVLGVIVGVASFVFIKSVYGMEDFFNRRIKGDYYRQHMIGMVFVGITLYVFQAMTGHYYVEGVGYAAVQDMLSGGLPAGLLMILFFSKLFVTSSALGSGASGGIFSPAIFLGAAVGGAYWTVMHGLFPGLATGPAGFVVAGMAGVAGGSTGAAMAAVVMLFEMTLGYSFVVPMIITVAVSYGIRKMLSRESIYTLRIARRGHQISDMMQRGLPFFRTAGDIMETQIVSLPVSATLASFARESLSRAEVSYFLLEEGGEVVGVSPIEKTLQALDLCKTELPLSGLRENYIEVTEDAILIDVVARMRREGASLAIVREQNTTSVAGVRGLVSKRRIADIVMESSRTFFE